MNCRVPDTGTMSSDGASPTQTQGQLSSLHTCVYVCVNYFLCHRAVLCVYVCIFFLSFFYFLVLHIAYYANNCSCTFQQLQPSPPLLDDKVQDTSMTPVAPPVLSTTRLTEAVSLFSGSDTITTRLDSANSACSQRSKSINELLIIAGVSSFITLT